MPQLSVQRSRRFGHDRVYVQDATRTQVGCLNLVTGMLTLERMDLREAVLATLARHGHVPAEVPGDGPGDTAGRLPEGWTAVHEVPIGPRGVTLDHLLIGPGGVFAVLAAHHPGAAVAVADEEFRADGRRQPWVRTVRYAARRTGRLLSVAAGSAVVVTGVVAVAGARELSVRQQPADVRVESHRRLGRWLQAQPEVLGSTEVDRLRVAARDVATWP